MPIIVTSEKETTVITLKERCTADDTHQVIDETKQSLTISPKLRLETKEAESVDTCTIQFILSVAATAERLENADNPFLSDVLNRWGLPPLES